MIMASRKAGTRTAREMNLSASKHAVVGLRPIKERNKRSEAMIEEQILFMKETQIAMQKTCESLEKALTENDQQKSEEELQRLFKRSEELLVIVQVLVKIRNELAHGRLDLERAIRTNSGVDAAKRRVKWLQDRLEKVLLTARSYCLLYNKSSPTKQSKSPIFKEQISENLWNRLSAGQQQFLQQSEKRNMGETWEERDVAPMVKEMAKMVPAGSDGLLESIPQEKNQPAVIVTEIEQENATSQPEGSVNEVPSKDGAPKRKHRKRSDGATGGQKNYDQNKLTKLLPQAGDHAYESDKESDTTAEPNSDVEDFDDQRSDSIVSSVDAADLETAAVEVSAPSDNEAHAGMEDSLSVAKHGIVDQGDLLVNKEESKDMVDEYWSSDHHKFEWSDYMLSVDPRSWHALGLVVPESFLSKEKPSFDPDLPWKEKPMKVNSVIDVHKIALDKLLLRLHRMYEAIGQATQTTINPVLKDEKIETVMGKLELEVDGGPVVETVKQQQGIQPAIVKHSTSPVSLPRIVSPVQYVAAQKSFTSETYPVMSPHPAAIRTARRNPQKHYPQNSSAWCENPVGGNRMPQVVKTKSKPKFAKRKSIVQPRYMPQRKQESPKNQPISELDLANNSVWKPSLVMKIVTVLKGFSDLEREQSGILDFDSPKWKRVETLLGEEGVLSSNSTIAAEAAKTLGQLKCRDKKVIDSLREVIKKQSDARVCYEASKSMILLGTWDPYAMAIIKQSIRTGNKDVVLELLSTMTKARNIAFVDKSSCEFKELVALLIFTIKTRSQELAFHAAVSLGRLCVVEPVSRAYLSTRLPGLSPQDKGEALYVLIKQMNCKDRLVVEALLQQLSTAHNWKLRMEAADLLIFIGARDVFKMKSADEVFDILEGLLWDHANKELRSKASEALGALDLRQRACQLVLRRLEDPTEEVRGRAVVSLATLGMKGVKEMKALLDILELDSSGYVRIQVVRAFGHMEWNDPRILRSLREREKGEGTLAKEARKTLTFLLRFAGRSTVAE